MRKYIRFVSKIVIKNIRLVWFFSLAISITLAYLLCFSTFLKKLISNDSNLASLTTFSNDVYVPLEQQTEIYKNCGMKLQCASDSFPVHLYTGLRNAEMPQICINEQKLPSSRIGRGFNIAIFNTITSTIVRLGHFDMFAETSESMEIFLEVLNENDIVIIVTHDEASSKLSDRARILLNELGSAHIQDLDYRDVWVFVGQKGINGFSDYEQIEYLISSSHWPKPINKKFCIPKKLTGIVLRPDPMAYINSEKDSVCLKSMFNTCICNRNVYSTTRHDMNFIGTPIIIIPGPDINIFRMQAEALLLNKRLNTENVHVFCQKDEIYVTQLSQFFKFKIHYLDNSLSSADYTYVFHKTLEKAWELFQYAQYIIILEEGVIPNIDFLSFMHNAQKILDKDESLSAASAWNGNTDERSMHNRSSVSRTNLFPGLGVLMKRSTYEKYLKNKLVICCHKRSWEGWNLGSPVELIVPEVSRIFKVFSPFEQHNDSKLFNVQNSNSKPAFPSEEISNLTLPMGNSLLAQELSSCLILSNDIVIKKCISVNVDIPDRMMTSQPLCICYEQENSSDSNILSILLSCFDNKDNSPLTENKISGVTEAGHNIFIIGSLSPFFIHLPKIPELFNRKHIKIIEQTNRLN